MIDKVEDIQFVIINWKDRKIELHDQSASLLQIGTPAATIGFAKSSPVGLVLQGITKWCHGHYMEDRHGYR